MINQDQISHFNLRSIPSNRADAIDTDQVDRLSAAVSGNPTYTGAIDWAQYYRRLQDGRTALETKLSICRDLLILGQTQDPLFHDCVDVLHNVLGKSLINPPILNSYLIEALIQLGSVEAQHTISRAFSTHRVDQSITGPWPLVQAKLGLVPYHTIQASLTASMAAPMAAPMVASMAPPPAQQPKQWSAGEGFARKPKATSRFKRRRH